MRTCCRTEARIASSRTGVPEKETSKQSCRSPGSNRDGYLYPEDFKSPASAISPLRPGAHFRYLGTSQRCRDSASGRRCRQNRSSPGFVWNPRPHSPCRADLANRLYSVDRPPAERDRMTAALWRQGRDYPTLALSADPGPAARKGEVRAKALALGDSRLCPRNSSARPRGGVQPERRGRTGQDSRCAGEDLEPARPPVGLGRPRPAHEACPARTEPGNRPRPSSPRRRHAIAGLQDEKAQSSSFKSRSDRQVRNPTRERS